MQPNDVAAEAILVANWPNGNGNMDRLPLNPSRIGSSNNGIPTTGSLITLNGERPTTPPSPPLNGTPKCLTCQNGMRTSYGPKRLAQLQAMPDEQVLAIEPSVFCDCESGQTAKRIRERRVAGWANFTKATAQANQEHAALRKQQLFLDAEVPVKFREITLQSCMARYGNDPGKRPAIQAAQAFLAQGRLPKPGAPGEYYYGLYFWGEFGMGKTSILSAVFTPLAERLGGGLWLPFVSFMSQVRKGYSDDTAEAKKEMAMATPVLMFEDFGSLARDEQTAHTQDVLWQILYHRNANNLPTLITSNLCAEQAASQFNAGIAQRILEALKPYHVTGRIVRNLG